MSESSGTWIVRDYDRENEVEVDSREEAEEKAETARQLGSDDVEVIPPDGPEEEPPQEARPARLVDQPEELGAGGNLPEASAGSPAAAGPLEPVDPEGTVEMYHQYEELKSDLLKEEDYQDDMFIKKSGWRKIATAFNVDVSILDRERDVDDQGIIEYTVVASATAPNGKTAEAVGMAQTSESNFMETLDFEDEVKGNDEELREDPDVLKVDGKYRRLKDPRAVKEHDVLTLASTRAKNRAISDLVGGGEVSAEEVR